MKTVSCVDVQLWLTSHPYAASLAHPSLALCAHVSHCARCRGALLLLAVEVLQAPLELEQTTCEQCEQDLAAYIDIERDEGFAEAYSAYPHVWWHLWTCLTCAQTYAMVTTLQQAEAAGIIAPMPLTSLLRTALPNTRLPLLHISLPRRFFVPMLVPHYGGTWGDQDDTVIHEAEDDGYEFRASVCKRDGQWLVVITVQPPLIGTAVIRLGREIFRAPLGPDGIANVGPIPAALMTSSTGPDMDIKIEPVGY